MTKNDRFVLFLSLVALFITAGIANRIFENIPHIEDEIAYVWQAQTIARGDLALNSPVCPECFLVPFVVDYNGLRFGKYPIGWPVVLSFGVRFGIRDWINPILAALCIWYTYRLIKKLAGEQTGLIAALLTLTSPFFLMNSSTLLSHLWGYFLTLVFISAWIDSFLRSNSLPAWIPPFTAGLGLGLLATTRPLTALGVALPFFMNGLWIFFKETPPQRLKVILIGTITGCLAATIFLWQFAVTGNPWLNPYELWWPYDKIGFGLGVGLQEGGYTPIYAKMNARFSLSVGTSDLFGWGNYSWIFAPFGLWSLRKTRSAWLITSILPCLILAYTLYWIGSWLFGPRYYFEGLISMVLLSAAGISWAAGKLPQNPISIRKNRFSTFRWFCITTIVTGFIAANLLFYIPIRIGSMVNLFSASSDQLTPFQSKSAQMLTPALVIVHRQHTWREYATLLELSNPYFDTSFVFTFSRGKEKDQLVAAQFPDRKVWHYYPTSPTLFFTSPIQSNPK